jgi:hydroxymethylpyrimidine/phosphomethylpyrimidine kinase
MPRVRTSHCDHGHSCALSAAAEVACGRRVGAYFSQAHSDAEMAVELFVLGPQGP